MNIYIIWFGFQLFVSLIINLSDIVSNK